MSDSHHEEFADELAHIISSPEYDCFYFDIELDPGELTILFEENISEDSIKELTSPELNDLSLLLSDCDSIFSEMGFSEIDLLVSFPSGNEDKIPSGESKVHIEVLSVLWGNRLPIPDGSLPLSSHDGCNHKVAKELGKISKHLMQGTSLTNSESDVSFVEFDKFAYKKGETLLLILPPEWSKFVTDVKLVQDLHTTNIDQLHAYLGQHEFHANEVRLMHERNSDPLALVATHQMTQSPYQTHQNSYQNTQFQSQVLPYQSPQYGSPYQSQQYSNNQSSTPLSITYPSNDYQSSVHHNTYSPSSSIPQLEYGPSVNQQPEYSQPQHLFSIIIHPSIT
ncbi:hypothetical protein Tco_0711350 [Tanacetum coccineum]